MWVLNFHQRSWGLNRHELQVFSKLLQNCKSQRHAKGYWLLRLYLDISRYFLDVSGWFSMFPVSSKVNRLNRWWSATLPASRRSLGLLHLSVTWGMFASALKPCPGFRTPFAVASLLEEEVLHLSPKMPQTPLAILIIILIYLTELAHTGQWWNMRRHLNYPKLSFSIIVSQCPRGQCKNM